MDIPWLVARVSGDQVPGQGVGGVSGARSGRVECCGVGGVFGEPGVRSGCWRGVRGARCKVRVLAGCSGSRVQGQGVGRVSGEPGARSGRVERRDVGDPSLQHSLQVQLGGVGLRTARSAEHVAVCPDPLVGNCNTTQSMHVTRSTHLT